MSADLVIRGARVVTHAGEFEGGVAVADGRIVATGSDDALPRGHREIDAAGRVLLPGVIDPHCHLGGAFAYDDDMHTETAGAALGGITTILQYTRTTAPSYIPLWQERTEVGERESVIDFGFHFAIQTDGHIAEIPRIAAETGVQSFKLYFGYADDNPIGIVPANDGWVWATMTAAAQLPRGVVSVHCENAAIAEWAGRDVRESGRQDLAAYTESRPSFSELETIGRMILLAEQTGCPLYVVHTTIADGPPLAEAARARGVDVVIETCPHYLTRTAYDPDLDMRAKILPPLRDHEELEGLWRAIRAGSVRTLGSDHVPYPPKAGVDLWTEKPGVVSFPWELPLMITEWQRRGLPLERLVALNSYGPAKRFGLYPRKGSLLPGADADLVLIDLDQERTVVHEGKGTCIYEGMRLRGWPTLTVSRGHVVAEDGEVPSDAFGHGRYVYR